MLAGVLGTVLVFWERHLGDKAMVPHAIFKSLSIYAIVAFSFMTRFCLLIFSYVRLHSHLFTGSTDARRSTSRSTTKLVAATPPLNPASTSFP